MQFISKYLLPNGNATLEFALIVIRLRGKQIRRAVEKNKY